MDDKIANQIVDLQNLSVFWSIGSSIASIILAIVAILLSVYFYTQSKKSEKDITNSLSKIETQSQTIEKITGKQIERLTEHLTKQSGLDEIHTDLKMIAHMATTMKQDGQVTTIGSNERLEIIKYIIGSYYYCATTNYYAYMSLPEASKFDKENTFHIRTKNILDMTASDINYIRGQFDFLKITEDEIKKSGLEGLYKEALEVWLPNVKDAASAFVKIEELKRSS